jgi:hypothetical protein
MREKINAIIEGLHKVNERFELEDGEFVEFVKDYEYGQELWIDIDSKILSVEEKDESLLNSCGIDYAEYLWGKKKKIYKIIKSGEDWQFVICKGTRAKYDSSDRDVFLEFGYSHRLEFSDVDSLFENSYGGPYLRVVSGWDSGGNTKTKSIKDLEKDLMNKVSGEDKWNDSEFKTKK